MLERWTIAPSPTRADARRHLVLLQADTADVHALIRRFGALCGRPQKERALRGYNFSLALHNPTKKDLAGVEQFLREASPAGYASPPSPAQGAVPTLPPPRSVGARPAAESSREAAGPRPAPGSGMSPGTGRAENDPRPGKAAAPGPIPVSTQPRPLKAGEPPAPLNAPPPAAAPAPAAPRKPPPGPPRPPAAPAERKLWGVELALEPARGFEDFTVGSFNRFAHAASMAVVSNPGAMYNPLFLYGTPGVGKTHLLMAIARSFQEAAPQEPVLFTTGPRLSRAARLAAAAGRLAELEARAKRSKALMIDDVHLLEVAEHNQAALAALFAHYFDSGKHVAMTSVYPPRALGGLEEALRFQISSGWSVEMKPPTPEAQKSLLSTSLARVGFSADEAEADLLYESLGDGFFELGRWLRRLKSLAALRSARSQPAALRDLLPLLFGQDLPPGAASSEEEMRGLVAGRPEPRAETPVPVPLAAFFPKGMEEHARYMLLQLQAVFSGQKLPFPFRVASSQGYDPDQLYGIPFSIGEACARAGARAALVLGPGPGSGLSSREGELQHALERILEGVDVPLGWIPFVRIRERPPYFRALLDLGVTVPEP